MPQLLFLVLDFSALIVQNYVITDSFWFACFAVSTWELYGLNVNIGGMQDFKTNNQSSPKPLTTPAYCSFVVIPSYHSAELSRFPFVLIFMKSLDNRKIIFKSPYIKLGFIKETQRHFQKVAIPLSTFVRSSLTY